MDAKYAELVIASIGDLLKGFEKVRHAVLANAARPIGPIACGDRLLCTTREDGDDLMVFRVDRP